MRHFVTLLLGGNLGDRAAILAAARVALAERVGPLVKISNEYTTEPWGSFDPSESAPQPFLNQALTIETTLRPEEVLDCIQQIERKLGRSAHTPEYASTGEQLYRGRTIDIDILFYDSEIIDEERLTVPHPRLAERRFALEPLAEIMPDFVHPVLKISLKDLFNSLLLDESQ